MKKILACLLALVMLVSLAACSADDSEEKESKKTEESGAVLGTIRGQVYENPYIGIGCRLDDDWYYYTDEEISEINGFAFDRVDEDARELLESANVVFDMYAGNGRDNININLEKCSASLLENIDIEENLNKLIPMLKRVYESSGYSDISSRVITVELDGKEQYALRTEAKIYGDDVFLLQLQIPCEKHMSSVTIVSFGTDNTEAYLDYLYWLD